MIKDYTTQKCCLNCDGFCWWDGDYCCTMEMMIHQYGYPNGIWFDRDIDKTMKTKNKCKDYSYRHHEKYPESENMYIKEYKKFKVWDRLCEQLDQHVTNKWKNPKVEAVIEWVHNHYFNNLNNK